MFDKRFNFRKTDSILFWERCAQSWSLLNTVGGPVKWNLKFLRLTIWNLNQWPQISQKPFKIWTKMSWFQIIGFSNGHSFEIQTIWNPIFKNSGFRMYLDFEGSSNFTDVLSLKFLSLHGWDSPSSTITFSTFSSLKKSKLKDKIAEFYPWWISSLNPDS